MEAKALRELHLFSGAGGGILGGILLGHTCVCAVEIEPYCRKVLLQRQRDGILPKFPIWDDVRTFDGKPWKGLVDVVCAGIPCQRVSAAGKGGGFLDQDYYAAFKRIVREIGSSAILLENSPFLVYRGLSGVLRDLACMGYDARWGVLGASDAGAPHKRKRIWVLAYAERRERVGALRRRNFRVGRQQQYVPWDERPESALSRLRGMDDGMAGVVDRTNAIRNGQVPIVAALAWETLSGSTVVNGNEEHLVSPGSPKSASGLISYNKGERAG